MSKYRNLDTGDVFPASWTDAIQEFVGTMSSNVVIEKASASSIRIPADVGSGQVSIGVGGLFRYRTTTAGPVSVPSATPGTYDIYVTATANSFSNSPVPDTDNTDYNFTLHVVVGGSGSPSGGGITANRKIGELDYDGSTITVIRNLTIDLDATLKALSAVTTANNKLIYATGVDTFATATLTSFGRTLIDDADAATARATLGSVIGTDVQAFDGTLAALAGVTVANNKLIYATGADAFTTTDLTSLARTLLAGGSSSAMRSTLGAVIGVDMQAWDPTLDALAGVTTANNKLIYWTGVDTAATTDLTAFARTILDDGSASATRTTLGLVIGTDVEAHDATLTALAGVTTAADKLIYATGVDAFATADLTSFARTLLDDSSASAARSTLGTAATSHTHVAADMTDFAGAIRSAGKSIIPGEESRTNTAYGFLTTNDKVTGLVLPTDGLIAVVVDMMWWQDNSDAARAAIFVGASQLKAWTADSSGNPELQAAALAGSTGNYNMLVSGSFGLAGFNGVEPSPDVGPVALGSYGERGHDDGLGAWVALGGGATEQLYAGADRPSFGGVCLIRAPAGTYDVGVKFKASSGAVKVKERKLWAWTMTF